jgi:membrane protein YdbS with pleckstrin-like domain
MTLAPQGLEDDKKHSLGNRAFFIFLSRRIKYVVLIYLFTFGVWYAQRWIPPVYAPFGDYAAKLLLLLSCFYFFFVIFETYLEYRYYTYFFTEEAFIMTYGYVVRNEVATLYHHIQNVNIERSVLDRLIGVSKLIILMTGSDRETRRNQIVLPAISQKKARTVQAELLRRARRRAANLEG